VTAGLTVPPIVSPWTAAAAGSVQRSAETETDILASADTRRVRFVVTAEPRPRAQNEPADASVEVAAFEHRRGEWELIGRQSLGETWFWEVVTSAQGVCRLGVSEHPAPSLTLSLRYSPSLGCAEPMRFAVVDGELVRE
jgi:hypothetical protein